MVVGWVSATFRDPRYEKEAYIFLKKALAFTIKQKKRGKSTNWTEFWNGWAPGPKARSDLFLDAVYSSRLISVSAAAERSSNFLY